jgi:hypothetical protein
MHLFILAVVSTVLLFGGCFLYVGQAWSGPQASTRILIGGAIAAASGLVGNVIAVCWLLKLLWEAILG